jgi:RNA polymerase sporulation-specific sigma factor
LSAVDAETLPAPTPTDPAALFEENVRLAFHMAKKAIYPRDGFDPADVKQESLIAIWEAARTYDSAKGSFGSWAAMKARDRIKRFFRLKRNRPLRQAALYYDDDGEEAGSALDDVMARPGGSTLATQEQVQGLLARLPSRARRVVEMRFGFEGGAERTTGEIALELGVSRQRADQVLQWALEKLRPAAVRRGLAWG